MIFRLILATVFTVVATFNANPFLWAQTENSPGVMTMVGVGQVNVVPDMASISLGVEVKAPTADRALRLNSVRVDEILQVLADRGIARADIQTTQVSLYPQWANQSRSYDQPLAITGFLATNLLNIKIRNLDFLGPTLDALTKTGANRIDNIRLEIAKPKPSMDRARALAMEDALQKARLYADVANLTLGAILSIAETPNTRPDARRFATTALAQDTVPIAAGNLTLKAEITVQFRISPR